jgi:RHS repeat-associated protein
VIREVSPDRGTLTYWYDGAGNLTQMVDGDGQQTNYAYDNANRLTSATFAGASAETITYSYDGTSGGNKGVGRLTGVSEESGSSAFVYDAQGRVTGDTKVIQGKSYAVHYAYDRNGLVTGMTLPSGRTVTITRAADGLVTDITTKATPTSASETIVSGVAYRPFGPLQGLTFGNGLALTRTFDQNDWLGRIEVKATGVTSLDLSFGRNDNGQLTSVTDNAASGRGATFAYTDSGRLASADGVWGNDGYTYDAAGNRLDKARQVGMTTTHETAVVASASNRVNTVVDGASATLRTLTWRAGGDLSQAVYTSGTTFDYQYNARKRLSLVKVNTVDRAQYGYDFRGLRVWADVSGVSAFHSHYIFDADGHILAQHDGASGAVLAEYIWLEDTLVAVIDSSTPTVQTFFVHTGQLDEPLVMTEASKAKVWDAYVEPYGVAQMFAAPSVGLLVRLPGQWHELETGELFQNWNRNYDPTLGRYIEADPLGIEAGQNLYGYVGGNPLNRRDVRGLGPRGTAIGAAFGTGITALASLAGDAVTGGANIAATPAELAFGAAIFGAAGNYIEDTWFSKRVAYCPPLPTIHTARPPGFLPGPTGAEEWGRRNGMGAAEGRRRFHDIKQNDRGRGGGRGRDDYSTNPDTGDVVGPDGVDAGNLGDPHA